MRAVSVGQIYELPDDYHPDSPHRRLQVVAVTDGTAACEVLVWKGKPRMRGTRCMLPDDARYVLAAPDTGKPTKHRVRRRTALKG